MLAETTALLSSNGSGEGNNESGGGDSLSVRNAGSSGPDGSDHRGWTAIGPYGSERHLREAALVLTSMDVPHGMTRSMGGGFLLVRDSDYDRARSNLDRFEEENRDFPPTRPVERARYRGPPLVALQIFIKKK